MLRYLFNRSADEQELLHIPGIDAERVKLYGPRFIKLLEKAFAQYDTMMTARNRPEDPNHRNVVEISDDEDSDFYEPSQEQDYKDTSVAETSGYFDEVAEFNRQGKFHETFLHQILTSKLPNTESSQRNPQGALADAATDQVQGHSRKQRLRGAASGLPLARGEDQVPV